MSDPYCYENSSTLINKLGIKDNEKLAEIEYAITSAELFVLRQNYLDGNYDFSHLCDFHKHIFGKLYEWAGKPRTINIQKAESILGYTSIEYEDYQKIEGAANKALSNMKSIDWEHLSS